MKNRKCNILIFGILSSGSSAIVDLLKEYKNVNVIPDEFDDFRVSGLVADQLDYQQSINFPNNIDKYIKNTSKKRLVYNIFPIFKWNSSTLFGIKNRYKYSLVRIKQLYLLQNLNIKLKSNIPFDDKIRYANDWIKDIGNINVKNKEFNVFNQPLEIGIDDKIWRAVFNPYKLICVYRDPRDQLADIIKRGLLSATYGGYSMTLAGVNSQSIYGRERMGAIKFHIDAIRKRMEWIDLMHSKLSREEFLLIDFEGLINDYHRYKRVIENFVGNSKDNHTQKNMFFDPNTSNNNIGIYKNILSHEELELLSELNSWYERIKLRNSLIINELN